MARGLCQGEHRRVKYYLAVHVRWEYANVGKGVLWGIELREIILRGVLMRYQAILMDVSYSIHMIIWTEYMQKL